METFGGQGQGQQPVQKEKARAKGKEAKEQRVRGQMSGVRGRYQSVSRKRQADMDDMGMKRGAANKRDKPSKTKQGCVLSHANA